LSTTAASGLHAIELRQQAARGDFSALVTEQLIDLRQNPMVSFDYRFPFAGRPRLNLFFRRGGVIHEVIFSDTSEAPKEQPPIPSTRSLWETGIKEACIPWNRATHPSAN
jgi:hypothetical protein